MLFDGAHRLGTLSGPALTATITDTTRELTPDARSRIRSIRPLTDANPIVVTVAGANALSDTVTETAYSVRQPSGIYRCRENWNLTRIALSIPAGTRWSHAQGLDVEIRSGGRS